MRTVAEIYSAIQELSLPERCELEALLHPFEDDDWDKQMKRDAQPGGKLYKLMKESEKNAEAGKLVDLPVCYKK
jgi:hypothetical protein